MLKVNNKRTGKICGICSFHKKQTIPANKYMLKFNNRNAKITRKICSKLMIKTPKQRQ